MRMLLNGLRPAFFFAPADAGGSGGSGGSGDGAGAGAGTGTGAGAGTGAGTGATGGSAGAGAGSGSPLRLSDDTLIEVDGKPVRYGDHSKNFVSRDQVGNLVREIIAAAGARRQPQQQQTQQTRPDPFADIEGMPVVDGKTAAALMRRLVSEGFGPRDKVIQALQKQIQDLTGHVTTERTGSLQNDYAISRDQIIASLPIPKSEKGIDGSKEALSEFVDGVFWKYDFEQRFKDPRSREHVQKEFADTVKKEFEQQQRN